MGGGGAKIVYLNLIDATFGLECVRAADHYLVRVHFGQDPNEILAVFFGFAFQAAHFHIKFRRIPFQTGLLLQTIKR